MQNLLSFLIDEVPNRVSPLKKPHPTEQNPLKKTPTKKPQQQKTPKVLAASPLIAAFLVFFCIPDFSLCIY